MYSSWTKAVDLEQWSGHADARLRLPALVRRLIWATTKGQSVFRFPAQEGVQRPGWDGELVVAQGNPWVPDGESVWEMSTGADPEAKADENFEKRTKATPAAEAAQRTFVFVTPRKWIGRQQWAEARRKAGPWRDVRVLDSDDLEHWLEIAWAVDIWFARSLGKRPADVVDLTHHWETLHQLTEPPLPAAAFLAGRIAARDSLNQALSGPPQEVRVAALSVQEVIDFVAAVHGSQGEEDALPARAVIVSSADALRQLSTSTEPLVFLPAPELAVDRAAITRAVKGGHHIITHRPYSTHAESDSIRLPRAWRHELEQGLVAAGFPEATAGRWARESGGSLLVLQRLAAPNMGNVGPAWTQPAEAAKLAPFVLLGSWDDAKPADRAAVASVTGRPYEEALAIAASWLARPDGPFRRNGTQWHFLSREDAWLHLAPQLTWTQLDAFAQLAGTVLTEDDPRFDMPVDERVFAAIYDKLPRHSAQLREGVGQTLALLGADLIPFPALPPDAVLWYPRRIVRDLVAPGITAQRWYSLAPVFSLLAEAAPLEFLEAVERDVGSPQPALLALFVDGGNAVFGGSLHYHLVWALGALAWHPDYLTRTALVLARLVAIDPGGNSGPRPRDMLHSIFRIWFPQTAATAEQRFEVIDEIIRHVPAEGWRLLMSLLPKGTDTGSATYPPRWREWPSVKSPRVPRDVQVRQVEWIAARLFTLCQGDDARLLELAKEFDHLPPKEFDALAAHLRTLDLNALAEPSRLALWTALDRKVRDHEYFTKAHWRMSADRLAKVKEVVAYLAPTSTATRRRWLFEHHYVHMGDMNLSHEEQEKLHEAKKREAVEEIFRAGGLDAVVEFAVTVPYPWAVGHTLAASGLVSDWRTILPRYLDDPRPAANTFAQGYASTTFYAQSWAWVEALPLSSWSPQAAAQLLSVLPFGQRTWTMTNALGSDVSARYWGAIMPRTHGLTAAEAETATRQLLQHGRALEAADYVPMVYHTKLTLPADMLALVLEQAITPINEAAGRERDVSHTVHDLEETLTFLQNAPDVDEARAAKLEWAYLPLLRHGSASPKFLHRELARDPAFFACCVAMVYRRLGPKPAESAAQSEHSPGQIQLAGELLNSWKQHPAVIAQGGPDHVALNKWIDEARRLCGANGRLDACDSLIGELFASSPSEADGSWPVIAIRDAAERIGTPAILDGFRVAIFNGGGATMRGPHEGGDQERDRAKKYHSFADSCQMRWPWVAATLRELARQYEAGARRMDDQADDHH